MKESVLKEDEVNELIVSYLTNSINPGDLRKLTLWINSSIDNRHYFNAAKDAWILSAGKKSKSSMSEDEAWLEFKNRTSGTGEELPGKKLRNLITGYMLKAAIWLLFMGFGSALTYLAINNSDNFSSKPVSITVPLGAKSNIILPDGSNVWLNAGTTLVYNKEYGKKERKLQLTGEAFFDVAKDKKHPFIVEVEGIVVRALGTKFNVKAYPEENSVSATLEEGKIDVELMNILGEKQTVMLSPNEKIIYVKDKMESSKVVVQGEREANRDLITENTGTENIPKARILSNVQTELYTSWKETRWIIKGEPLGTLAPVLERKYNLNIIFSDDELKDFKFTGTIENETIEQLLNALKLTAPIDYKIDKDTVRLFVDNNIKNNFQKIMRNKN